MQNDVKCYYMLLVGYLKFGINSNGGYMFRDEEFDNNIGAAIQYFREKYRISQSKLCKGLCSTSTLSRIETGERDADALLLETLLERLGKVPNQFELILSDFDYDAYLTRKEIIKGIEDKDIDEAYRLLDIYDELAEDKVSPHRQFIMISQAHLNELKGGKVEVTLDLLMEAITCTVPDFNTKKLSNYFLSNSEFNIIIDILQKMISANMINDAEKVLDQIIDYLFWHEYMENSKRHYPKVASIGGKFYLEQKKFDKALELCEKGLENHRGSYKMEYLGELLNIKARATEISLKAKNEWKDNKKKECLRLFIESYYVLDFCSEDIEAGKVNQHLQEGYQWEGID